MRRAAILVLVGCGEPTIDLPDAQSVKLFFSSPFDYAAYHSYRAASVAVGGTNPLKLSYVTDEVLPHYVGPFDHPYTAVVVGDALRVVDQQPDVVTLEGVHEGPAELQILGEDGTLYGRHVVGASVADTLAVLTTVGDVEVSDLQGPLSFWPGDYDLHVVLPNPSGGPATIYADSSMQLSMPGAEVKPYNRLHLPNAIVGVYPISIVAAGKPYMRDFVVVDQADSISTAGMLPTTVAPNALTTVCFEARNAGRLIMGAPWQFAVSGVALSYLYEHPTCVTISTHDTSGTVTFTGSAGGQSLSIDIPVGP